MGNQLRDAVLGVMHAGAREFAPDLIADHDLAALTGSGRKLEVVLGRLWGTLGEDALDCLLCLNVGLPNEAHMLAAVQLARGGKHVTLNFDTGIELAHDLLTGAAVLPHDAPRALHEALPGWRALVPAPGSLRVVGSHDEFQRWAADGRPRALLKLHGTLTKTQDGRVDVIVVDEEELAALAPARRSAVEHLADDGSLLVTGYAGADPDVYGPLLDAAARVDTSWACYSLPTGSPVSQDCRTRGIRLRLGAPDGLATIALRDVLGLGAGEPPWPGEPRQDDGWETRFADWRDRLSGRYPAADLAQAWAWLVADGGDLDRAEALLARVVRATGSVSARVRLADTLYTRAAPGDRVRAARLYGALAWDRGTDPSTRNHCLVRSAGIARGRALLPGPGRGRAALWATTAPLLVMFLSRGGRDPQGVARASGAVQHTLLRFLEHAGTAASTRALPAFGLACGAAAGLGRAAADSSGNGNANALARSHNLLLQALAAYYRGVAPDPSLAGALARLRDTYSNAGDDAGAGNCVAALAVVAAAAGDPSMAAAFLNQARGLYGTGRPQGRPLPSGEALVGRLLQLFERHGMAVPARRRARRRQPWGG